MQLLLFSDYFDPENEDMKWYYDPIRNNRGTWSRPFTDATINVKLISYTEAICSGNELMRVAGIDISFTDTQQANEDLVLFKTGYGILIDSEYRVIVHPQLEEGTNLNKLENEDFKNILRSMETNESDALLYTYRNQKKIMGFSKLSKG